MAASKADELAPHLTVGSAEASSSRPRLAPGNEDHEVRCYFNPEKPYCPLFAEGSKAKEKAGLSSTTALLLVGGNEDIRNCELPLDTKTKRELPDNSLCY
jgi:hypothetical protein